MEILVDTKDLAKSQEIMERQAQEIADLKTSLIDALSQAGINHSDADLRAKANPYTGQTPYFLATTWDEGYTAAVKDRDCLQERNDELVAEVDRLREALEAIGKHALKSEQTTTYDETIEGYRTVYEDLILHARATHTPQPADTPCPECGTVGGGGRVTVCNGITTPPRLNMNTLPCPRCGATDAEIERQAQEIKAIELQKRDMGLHWQQIVDRLENKIADLREKCDKLAGGAVGFRCYCEDENDHAPNCPVQIAREVKG